MQRTRLAALAAALMLLAGSVVAAPRLWQAAPVRALTNCSTTEDALNADELQMLQLINTARANAGLKALKPSPNLNRAAAWKSADPSPSSHTDSLGRSPSTRTSDCGYPGGAAENIAWGYFGSAQAVFDAWMGSSGHRANILNVYYVVIGIGEHGTSWTTDFGLNDDSGSPPPTNPPPASTPPPTNTPLKTVAPPTNTPVPPTNTPIPPTPTPDPPKVGVQLGLSQGVNIITYVGPPQPAAWALWSIRGAVIDVSAWDNDAQRWDRYTLAGPEYVNSFTDFEPGRVYYLRLAYPVTWSY